MMIKLALLLLALPTFAAEPAKPVDKSSFRRFVELTLNEKYEIFEHKAAELMRLNRSQVPEEVSVEEAVAIHGFTTSFYKVVNPMLRKGELERARPFTEVLDAALRKMPVYKGLVFRGTHLKDEITGDFDVGKVVVFKSYTSASSTNMYPGNSRFVIESKSARRVSSLATMPSSGEVIFPRNTRFKILYKKENQDKATEYILLEVKD